MTLPNSTTTKFSQLKPFSPKLNTTKHCFSILGFHNHFNSRPHYSLCTSTHNKTRAKFSNSCFRCRCNADEDNGSLSSSCLEWDWNRWTRHFGDVELAENYASVLKFQLEDAIEKEDFQEAAKLKTAIAEATSKDSVAEIMSQLQKAIEEERYQDASKLCKHTGSGLVGWWVGYSKDSDDPFGRIVRITPGVGRFIGKSYSPRQLVCANPGTPLFEIFVVKGSDETYTMQVVYLQRTKGKSAKSPTLSPKPTINPSPSEVEDPPVEGVQENEIKTEKGINTEGAAEEGIKSVINFLKDKIPGLKVKVMNINIPGEVVNESNSREQSVQADNDKSGSGENAEEVQSDDELDSGDDTDDEDVEDLDAKLYIGGVVHNKEESPTKDEYVRVAAEIKDVERDTFLLHIPKQNLDHQTGDTMSLSDVKVAAIASQDASELMPPEVAKAFLSGYKASSKVSRDVREILKVAVSQAQKRSRLSEHTTFSRITASNDSLDPFDGLYVGAFGPYGTEVVQLRRKYGHWNNGDDESTDMVFEYVEAVKLTGDLNVPAGEVTFRAKIGKGSRLSNRGMYPDELGVKSSYKGQGRIADFGFKNPRWVDGELLQLSGKGIGPYVKSADLGFLYVVPEHSFLVLFNRLRLPE